MRSDDRNPVSYENPVLAGRSCQQRIRVHRVGIVQGVGSDVQHPLLGGLGLQGSFGGGLARQHVARVNFLSCDTLSPCA